MDKSKNLQSNPFQNKPWFFTCLQYKCFENTVGKGGIAHNKQFLLYPTVFSTYLESILPFSSNIESLSPNSISLDESKICHLGKG